MTDETTAPAGPESSVVAGESGKGFNMADVREAFTEAVESIEMGDDGSLDMQIRPQEPAPAAPESPGPGEPPEQLADDTPEYATEDLLAEIDNWEDRYKNLQGAYTRGQQELKEQGERLARLEGKLEAQAKTPPTDDGDPWYDGQPATQDIEALVAQRVEAALKDAVPGDVEELVSDWKIGKELQAVIAAHEDFPAYVPAIQKLLDTVSTDLTYEEAYQLAKQFGQPSVIAEPAPAAPADGPKTPDTPKAVVPAGAVPTHEELLRRSQALKTAQGDTNDAGFVAERAVDSPRDAIMNALEDTYGS